MVARAPLVIDAGRVQQLQSGDTLAGAITAPSLPTIVAVGTSAHSTVSPIVPGLPAGTAADDILLLFVQGDTALMGNSSVALPAGYEFIGPQNGVGQATVAGNTRMYIAWKRAVGGETAPSVSFGGDHGFAVIIGVRSCKATGDPYQVIDQTQKATASTALTTNVGSTYIANSLVVYGLTHATDVAGAQFSGATNADLANLTERFDDSTTDGTGGGLAIVTGEKAVAGDFSALTGTWATSTVDVTSCFAMLPNLSSEIAVRRNPEVHTYFACKKSAGGSQEQFFQKPDGCRWVDVLAIGGGGGGGNGRTTATAAGGGGAGGGCWARVVVMASDLLTAVNVTPGRGGPGAATNAAGGVAGTAGADSTFDVISSTSGINGNAQNSLAPGGAAGSGAASASGGVSGAGGGKGTAPAAANPGAQGLGAQGGGPVTANTGGAGGQAYEGGGGGGGGFSAANGSGGPSARGGGGGGGGGAASGSEQGGRGGGVQGANINPGQNGGVSSYRTLGGGGAGGGTNSAAAGNGGFPGGGGGGGGSSAGITQGGNGADGIVIVTVYF